MVPDRSPASALRAVHVTFQRDAQRRGPEVLLDAWPTSVAVAAAIARAGVAVEVTYAAHEDGVLTRERVRHHFVSDMATMPGPPAIRALRRPTRLIDKIRRLEPDIVHVHGLNTPMAVRYLCVAMNGVPVLVQDHGNAAPRGWRVPAWRWAYARLAGVGFTALDQVRPFVEAGVFTAALPVYDAIEGSSTFTPGDRDAARARSGLTGVPCVLWASRLDANKDPLMALAAFEHAAASLPQARLWCCYGDAPLLSVVRQRIATSPLLRERVVLLGRRAHADMETLFRAADFFLQTSHREGSGFALLEALSCGTTPLVTDIPPSRRIVGDAGALTPVGDARAMAEALVSWAARDRTRLREAARARFDHALSFDVIGQAWRSVYEQVLAAR